MPPACVVRLCSAVGMAFLADSSCVDRSDAACTLPHAHEGLPTVLPPTLLGFDGTLRSRTADAERGATVKGTDGDYETERRNLFESAFLRSLVIDGITGVARTADRKVFFSEGAKAF